MVCDCLPTPNWPAAMGECLCSSPSHNMARVMAEMNAMQAALSAVEAGADVTADHAGDVNHGDLAGLQGGQVPDEYYHLSWMDWLRQAEWPGLPPYSYGFFLRDDGTWQPVTSGEPLFTTWILGPPDLSEFNNDVGYITAEVDPVFLYWLGGPPNLSEFANDVGYILGTDVPANETDPIYSANTYAVGMDQGVATTDHPTFAGIDCGYDQADPNTDTCLENVWVSRRPDQGSYVWLDEYDEAAFWDKFYDSIAFSTSPSSGAASTMFRDDTTSCRWNAGVSPSPLIITIDSSTNQILNKNNDDYQIGITFRSADIDVHPSNIKVELWNNGLADYVVVFDEAPDIGGTGGYGWWLSPLLNSSGTANLVKLRITFTLPNPLPHIFRIQRLMVYHASAERDPWHLRRDGGTMYGSITMEALATVDGRDVSADGSRIDNLQSEILKLISLRG